MNGCPPKQQAEYFFFSRRQYPATIRTYASRKQNGKSESRRTGEFASQVAVEGTWGQFGVPAFHFLSATRSVWHGKPKSPLITQ